MILKSLPISIVSLHFQNADDNYKFERFFGFDVSSDAYDFAMEYIDTSALEKVFFQAVYDEIFVGGRHIQRNARSFVTHLEKQSIALKYLKILQPNNIYESLKNQIKNLQGKLN